MAATEGPYDDSTSARAPAARAQTRPQRVVWFPRRAGYTSETAMALHAARRTAAKPAAKLDVGGVTWGVVLTLLSWEVVSAADFLLPPVRQRRIGASEAR